MTKAEEIANQCAIKEEWFYGPLIKSINEALEWAAKQAESRDLCDHCNGPVYAAALIRDGKSA